ncbi:MAG: hypothetical protein K6E13_04145 [Lachnospiraceae bacterium]|nr:hypothetical protein [Lachnospiraceae bacterium]
MFNNLTMEDINIMVKAGYTFNLNDGNCSGMERNTRDEDMKELAGYEIDMLLKKMNKEDAGIFLNSLTVFELQDYCAEYDMELDIEDGCVTGIKSADTADISNVGA